MAEKNYLYYRDTPESMDIFAHFFWSLLVFFNSKKYKLAVLFGILPDILSWGIYSSYLVAKDLPMGRPMINNIPDWTFTLYDISHSIIIIAVVFGIVWLLFRKVPLFLYAWPLHVLIDIPTHTREFLPTPFLWPLSSWHFPGISWGTAAFMTTNYILIACAAVIVFIKKEGLLRIARKMLARH